MTDHDSDAQHGFHRHGDNAFVAEFSESEREVLINLVEQIIELLGERTDNHVDDHLLQWLELQHMIHHQKMKFYFDSYQMHMPTKLMQQSFADTQNQL